MFQAPYGPRTPHRGRILWWALVFGGVAIVVNAALIVGLHGTESPLRPLRSIDGQPYPETTQTGAQMHAGTWAENKKESKS